MPELVILYTSENGKWTGEIAQVDQEGTVTGQESFKQQEMSDVLLLAHNILNGMPSETRVVIQRPSLSGIKTFVMDDAFVNDLRNDPKKAKEHMGWPKTVISIGRNTY